MDIGALQAELDEISIILYQNREEEALLRVGQLFGKLKPVTDALLQLKNINGQEMAFFISAMYRELYAAFQQKDMLGMADCLQEYAMSATEIYKQMLGGK